MKRFLQQRSEFFRHVSIVMLGTAAAQAIPLAVSPLLTRIYGPEDFGIYAIYLAIGAIGTVAAAGRYEMAIMRPAREAEARSVFNLAIITAVITCVLLAFVLLATHALPWKGPTTELGDLQFLLPLSICALSVFSSVGYWLNRHKRYAQLSKLKVAQSILIAAGSVGAGYWIGGATGLIVGTLIGQVALALWPLLRLGGWRDASSDDNTLRGTASRYWKYPAVSMPTALLDTFSQQAPTLVFSRFYDMAATGHYNLGVRVLSSPAALISTAIGQVYFRRIAEIARETPRALPAEVISTAKKLLLIGLPIFLPLMLWGDVLFAWIFGAPWAKAGTYAQIIAFSAFVKFVVSPLSTLFIALERLGTAAKWQAAYFCTSIATLSLGLVVPPSTLLVALAIHDLAMYGLYFYLIMHTSRSLAMAAPQASNAPTSQ
jgi:O-antigen/teichoic acid export membrane protein